MGGQIQQCHLCADINDGHCDDFDIKGNKLSSAAVHETYEISVEANRDAAGQALEAHSLGETDYFTFSKAAGVCTWIMDPVEMTCTFYCKSGELLLVDDI